MAKSDRIDNPAIREYLYKFVPQKLNQNPLFVKVFGEDFANKRIRSNLIVAYSNEPVTIKGYAGYHTGVEKSITLCSSGKDGQLLTPEDIANDEELQEIVLHESVHAIFDRTIKECKELKIHYGTGLLERYKNADGTLSELGRGLNEGFTEWMCEKAGYKTRAYPELTNFIRLIEVSIGTERTMKLGKGGIKQRFPEILKLSQDEVNILLGKADQLYIVNQQLQTANSLKHSLERLLSENESLEDQKKIEEDISEVEESYFVNPLFLNYLRLNKLEASRETLVKYLSEKAIPQYNNQRNTEIIQIESFMLDRYFIKDLKRIFSSSTISKSDFENVRRIVSLLNTNLDSIPESLTENKSEFSVIYVKENYEKLAQRYLIQLTKETSEKYMSGKLGVRSFIEEIKQLCNNDPNKTQKFINEFIKNVAPEFRNDFEEIINRIWKFSDNDLFMRKVTETSIYKLKSQNPERNLSTSVIFDRENFFDRIGGSNIVDNINGDPNFVFTEDMSINNEYKMVMENFQKLKEEVFEKNPKAKIHIVLREVIVQDGEELRFYLIDKGELVPMRVEEKLDIQFKQDEKEEKRDETALTPVKVGFFASVTNKFKKMMNIFRNRGKDGAPNYIDEDEGRIVFEQKESDNKMDAYRVEDFDKKLAEKRAKEKREKSQEDYIQEQNEEQK